MNVCIAVISSRNSPLYIKTTKENELLCYHFRVHGALDIIQEKVGSITSEPLNNKDSGHQYLGLLYPIDEHNVFGYITNTNIKFVLVQEAQLDISGSSTAAQLDTKVRKTFQVLHDAYLNLVSSPFYAVNTPINPNESPAAKRFEEVVNSLLDSVVIP